MAITPQANFDFLVSAIGTNEPIKILPIEMRPESNRPFEAVIFFSPPTGIVFTQLFIIYGETPWKHQLSCLVGGGVGAVRNNGANY